MQYANNKGADQPAHPRSLISTFLVRCLDSIIPLVSISELSSLYLASVAAQAGLSLPWSQAPKTGFLVTRLNLWRWHTWHFNKTSYSFFQHDYEGVREFSYKDSEVYILCYSVADRDSFKNIKEFWAPEAKSHMKRKRPTILVGCQLDLRTPEECSAGELISTEEGESLAREIGAESFIECSSLAGYRTNDVFENSVLAVLKYRKKKSNIFNRLLKR